MGLLARSQDPDLHAQAEHQVSGRRAVLVEGREVFLRALRREGIDEQGQGLLRLDRIDRHARSDDGGAQVQAAELRGALSSGHGYRGHPRREERDDRSRPIPSAPDLTSSPPGKRVRRSCSTSGTAFATRRRSRSLTRPSASSPIPRPRSRRCWPATSTPSRASPTARRSTSSRAIRGSRCWSAGTEGKTILGINNKKKPLDDVRVRQAIAYAIDRKAIIDGAHERARRADRQPYDAQRSRLRRPDGHVSARSRRRRRRC